MIAAGSTSVTTHTAGVRTSGAPIGVESHLCLHDLDRPRIMSCQEPHNADAHIGTIRLWGPSTFRVPAACGARRLPLVGNAWTPAPGADCREPTGHNCHLSRRPGGARPAVPACAGAVAPEDSPWRATTTHGMSGEHRHQNVTASGVVSEVGFAAPRTFGSRGVLAALTAAPQSVSRHLQQPLAAQFRVVLVLTALAIPGMLAVATDSRLWRRQTVRYTRRTQSTEDQEVAQ